MPQLPAALFDFVMFAKDSIHGADRAIIDALIEQAGVDFRRGLVDILRLAQYVDDTLALMWRERPRGFGPLENRRRRQFRHGLTAMEVARDSPNAAQAAAIRPQSGGRAATASIRIPRRSPAGPAEEPLFFGSQ